MSHFRSEEHTSFYDSGPKNIKINEVPDVLMYREFLAKVSADDDAVALYVEIDESPLGNVRSLEYSATVVVDVDEEGKVIGVEILLPPEAKDVVSKIVKQVVEKKC